MYWIFFSTWSFRTYGLILPNVKKNPRPRLQSLLMLPATRAHCPEVLLYLSSFFFFSRDSWHFTLLEFHGSHGAVCMDIRMCWVRLCVMYICMYVCMYAWMCISIFVCMYKYICVRALKCMFLCTLVFVYEWVCIYERV